MSQEVVNVAADDLVVELECSPFLHGSEKNLRNKEYLMEMKRRNRRAVNDALSWNDCYRSCRLINRHAQTEIGN